VARQGKHPAAVVLLGAHATAHQQGQRAQQGQQGDRPAPPTVPGRALGARTPGAAAPGARTRFAKRQDTSELGSCRGDFGTQGVRTQGARPLGAARSGAAAGSGDSRRPRQAIGLQGEMHRGFRQSP
jgi:hypothetical protein